MFELIFLISLINFITSRNVSVFILSIFEYEKLSSEELSDKAMEIYNKLNEAINNLSVLSQE